MAAVCGAIVACSIVGVLIVSFIIIGVAILEDLPLCDALYFGTKEPYIVILPDFHNLSSSARNSLLAGTYKLSSEYNLQLLIEDKEDMIKLCVIKRHFTRVSACVDVGTDLQNLWICGPDMRPDCLPSAIVDRFFGLSLWYQEESTVMYKIVDIDSGAIYERTLTNTTTSLSDVWFGMIKCQPLLNLTWAVIAFGCLLIAICCLVCTVWCFWICCQRWKRKR